MRGTPTLWIAVAAVAGLAAALAVVANLGVAQVFGVSQPAAFSHQAHVDYGIKCTGCHLGAEDEEQATIPGISKCALCHVPGKASPKTSPELKEYVKAGREISWVRVHRVPKHVRFSHALHNKTAELECVVCHGDVAKMAEAFRRQPVRITMNRCMGCHAEKKVSLDCLSCHQ